MKLILYPTSFTLLILLTFSTVSHTLPYQSHSFNDLDYIIQQLIKGIDSFKIDISAIEHDSCMHYSTWKHNDNKCEVDDMHNKICCLGLRGDASSAPKLNDYFNTTDELVSVLQNPKYDFIWNRDKRLQQYNQTIYIALNIQYNHLSSVITKKWLSNMIRIISTRNLDIQLILSGPAVVNYFGNLCKQTSKACDDDARIIAAYPFILQGDTLDIPPLPFGSIKNFNIMFSDIPKFCSSEFPAYGDDLPYYFYELSHEQDVQFVANTYMSDQCNRSETHPDMSTIRITSNVDPEMIQSYLPHDNPFNDFTSATNILIETLEADKFIIFTYYDTRHNVTQVQVRALNESLNVVSGKQLQCPPPTKISYRAPYLLFHSKQQAQVFLLDASGFLTLYSMYTILSPGIATDIFVYEDECHLMQVDVGGQCADNSLSFTVTSLDAGMQVLTQCSDQIQAFDVNQIQNADLSVVLDSSNTLKGILFISAAHMNYGDQKDALYAFSLRYNMDFGQALSLMIPKSYIDFGVDPSVKLIENNNTLFVLEVHSNGICQCAAFINNGNMFKCGVSSTPNPHVAYLQNVQYHMNYNWGQLSEFEARIQSGKYVNGCDSKIMHAKFSNGENPSGVVFRNSTTGALQALVVNQYVEYGDLPLMTKLFCGATAPRSEGAIAGTVGISMFDVVDYELFGYL